MSLRVFTDSNGTEWQMWDVVPHVLLSERRVTHRRRALHPREQPERRRFDRRLVSSRRPVLGSGITAGWLCFEALTEKRRLTPIPGDWLKCPEVQLEQYCRQAKPAIRTSAAVDIAALLGGR
jgi:hypothetical protein